MTGAWLDEQEASQAAPVQTARIPHLTPSPNPSRHRTPRHTPAIKDQCVHPSKAGVLRPANARRVEKAMERRNALARRTRVHPTTPTRVSLGLVFRVKDGLAFSSRDGRHPAPTQVHLAMSCGPALVQDPQNNRCAPARNFPSHTPNRVSRTSLSRRRSTRPRVRTRARSPRTPTARARRKRSPWAST